MCVCVCVPDAVKLPTSIKGDGLFSCIYSVYTCNKNFLITIMFKTTTVSQTWYAFLEEYYVPVEM